MKKRVLAGIKKLAVLIGICAIAFWALFPIVWAIITAFKGPADINVLPPKLFFKLSLVNWEVINDDWNIAPFLKSSLIVSISSTLLTVMVGTLAAYSFSRFNIRGKRTLALDILTIRMIPPIVAAVPIFILSRRLGFYDSYILLVVLYTTFNLPIVVWLMKAFIDDISISIEEAALVDGCSRFQAFIRVILPLSVPGLISNVILVFIFSWNEFLFANIMVGGNHRTLPVMVALSIKQRAILWGPACMAAVISIIPIIILSLIIQRHIVAGLTFGAVKE